MFQVRLLSSLLLASGASLTLAQPMVDEEDLALAYGDKSFVSIATGSRQPVQKAPSAATVITSEEIASMGARTLSEALEAVPGLHVSRNTLQNNYAPTYGMRGILTGSSPHVLMMVNGIPRTSVYLGNSDETMVELPVDNIARIEVIRGPGSAVYGADAFAGTINIITKTAADIDRTSVAVGAGSFNSWDTWFQHGGRHGDFDVAAYLKIGSTDGQRRSIASDYQSGFDTAFGTTASRAPGSVNVGYDSIDGQADIGYGKFRLRAGYTRRDNLGTGAGIAGALDPEGKVQSERITSDLSWSDANIGRDLSLTLLASYMQLANEVTTPLRVFPAGADFTAIGGSAFPAGMLGKPDKWERQTRFSATSIYSGFADHRIRIGFGHDEMEIYKTAESKNFTLLPGSPTILPGGMTTATGADLFLAPHKRQLDYIYLQDEWSFARAWTLTGGVRYDNFSDFGSTTNPRLALVWEARHDLTAKLMYGTAFRAPSFVEQYATGNPIALGNSSLMPEKITTLEAALTWQASHDLQTSLSIFQHEITDMISQTGATYQNTGKQTGSGGELEVAWDATTSLRLTGHYAYQKNIDETTQTDAGYAPHHHLYSRADWRFTPGWKLSGQVNYVADRNRAWGDTRAAVPDYTAVDLTLRSDRPKRGWDFSASIYNLFDADIREPSKPTSSGVITYDLPMPGRTLWLQARYSL
ncbi:MULTISPECIES: TonB-dependent receptor plug domain-containing protein [Azonexaceae]|uniref:TonB-dependent receptor plug domain-containing protein n=1 Tax=Azonexaceae TaxID=2008795 RepID=UPI001CF81CCA|nr:MULTISPECIES: TonB-dependent receptor [Azonexaceae]UCV21585.1 TonB-dependent receptor [Ferribacterium limneticum]